MILSGKGIVLARLQYGFLLAGTLHGTQKKGCRSMRQPLSYHVLLLCVCYRTGLPDDGNLHLSGVSHLVLYLRCYLA